MKMSLFIAGCVLLASCTTDRRTPPPEKLGPDSYGIIRLSTAHLRAAPSRKTEMVDQSLMGHTVKLLEKSGDWFLVQTEYDYTGWMPKESLHRTNTQGLDQWQQSQKVRVNCNYAVVYSSPEIASIPVTDVTLNALLKFQEPEGTWTKVATPDGREGFIESRFTCDPNDFPRSPKALTESIIKTAYGMTGVPYLWGGNSTKANDCSGFVQTVFSANGIKLPRDARQQVQHGIPVKYDSSFTGIQAGDLLFFSENDRITHVGISLGRARFIHQSGDVHVSSLNPADPDFDPICTKKLAQVKRVISEAIAN